MFRKTRFSTCIFLLTCFFTVSSAIGQGFMVRPMVVELQARPGQTIETIIVVSNTASDKARVVEVTPLYLLQGNNGGWVGPDSLDENSIRKLRPCFDWYEQEHSEYIIAPLQDAQIPVRLNIPTDAFGTYSMALAIANQPDDKEGFRFIFRFVIPIIIDIEGRAGRKNIQFDDANLWFAENQKDREGNLLPPADLVVLSLSNIGDVGAEIRGTVNVLRQAGNGWRKVTTLDFEPEDILPGIAFNYIKPLTKRIPAGTYRINAVFEADGRRFRPMNKVVEYQGDPSIASVSDEVELMFEPSIIEIEGVSRARRSARLRIQNPSSNDLKLQFSFVTPKSLRGVAMGDILGDHFSCNEFTTATPKELQLAGGGEVTVSIQTAFPDDKDFPFRYSTLVVNAIQADGQLAFSKELLMYMHNRVATAEPQLLVEGTRLAQLDNNSYSISSSFTNIGNVHLQPDCSLVLWDQRGLQIVQRIEMATEQNIILPLGQPVYNGEMNLSSVEDGNYRLTVTYKYNENSLEDITAINIATNGGSKSVTIIE
jgi:hypothetical protein